MKIFLVTISLLLFSSFGQAGNSDQIASNLNPESSSAIADAPQSLLPKADSADALFYGYYDWGRGRDGWGYCYLWYDNGRVANGGYPVNDYYCERVNPSHFDWARSRDGYINCYQFTPYGVPMNQGYPVSRGYCGY